MKTVIDTNVFVSSFFGGKPRQIIDLWKQWRISLCLSADILDEYIRVLQELGLGSGTELEEFLRLFASTQNIEFTRKTPRLQVVKKDPDDDKFIECAVVLKVDLIVSGDKVLLAVGEYQGIPILSPADFLTKFASGNK
ncbi:MAG: putative toxin-antitoxin system toxin component, PIN family [Chrysiogenales bacterium]